jgi:xylan 1,4-beta-xylosidase
VSMMSYWTFSDVFEEQGVVKRPFYGGFGLIAAGHIPKASFNVFRLLHQLGAERLPVDSSSAIVTRRPDGSLVTAVWNYAPPEEAGAAKEVVLGFHGVTGSHRVRIQLVDRNHGSALTAWEAMGRPDFPSLEQQSLLRRAAELPAAEIRKFPPDGRVTLSLPPHSLALVTIIH